MRLVVIGASMRTERRGARAARRSVLEIVVLERGDAISYAACGLPYYIEGQVRSLDELSSIAGRIPAARNISADWNRSDRHPPFPQQVVLADGERIITTGSSSQQGSPGQRGNNGLDQPHVFTLHTLQDAGRLKEFIGVSGRNELLSSGGLHRSRDGRALRANGIAVSVLSARATSSAD